MIMMMMMIGVCGYSLFSQLCKRHARLVDDDDDDDDDWCVWLQPVLPAVSVTCVAGG